MSPVVEAITSYVYRVVMPVPLPLRFVNCYLIDTGSSWTIIDTGIHTALGEATWLQAWDELGIQAQQIDAIYVTHYHPDHYGMAGWLQALSGARVWMTPIEKATVERTWEVDPLQVATRNVHFWTQHGMPETVCAALQALFTSTIDQVQPLAKITALDVTQPLQLGNRVWQPYVLPGHADGQLGLYQPDDQVFLVADHVLPRITPNISLWPESRQDPLTAYLASFAGLPDCVQHVLPGHGTPFTDLQTRCLEIIDHHDQRLLAIEQATEQAKSAWEIGTLIFPMHQLSTHQVRFAMAETLAHLIYLVDNKRVNQTEQAAHILFSRV